MLLLTLGCALITKADYDKRIALDDSGLDCDEPTTFYEDADGDGFGNEETLEACEQPAGYAAQGGDCDDSTTGIFPGANEICNGVSDDCDPEVDEDPIDGKPHAPDLDEDGYPDLDSVESHCEGAQPPKWIPADAAEHDCDDGEAAIHPGADEVCNDEDDDCDDDVDEDPVDGTEYWIDEDGDDFGDAEGLVVACDRGDLADNDQDCDDDDDTVNPEGEEVEGDGVDNDCDGGGARIEGVRSVSSSARTRVIGTTSTGSLGDRFADLGDVDSDGMDDFLVAAPYAGTSFSGVVFLVHGPVSSGDLSIAEVSSTIFTLGNDGADAALGVSLAGGVDLLGGSSTLAMGAPWVGDFVGEVYLADAASLSGLENPSTHTILKGDTESRFGAAIGVGDGDGDGQADIAVGAPRADTYGTDSGVALVFLGPITENLRYTRADGTYWGTTEIELGSALDVADLDGDGVDDLVVSATKADAAGKSDCGAVYIIHGPLTDTASVTDAAVRLAGGNDSDRAGASIAALPDHDGDGRGDILVGTPAFDAGGGISTGNASLILGPFTGSSTLGAADVIINGSAANLNLGYRVASPGDLDSDGFSDFSVGIPGSSSYAGMVSTWYGPVSAGVYTQASADFGYIGTKASDGLYVPGPHGDYLSSGSAMLFGSIGLDSNTISSVGGFYVVEHPDL